MPRRGVSFLGTHYQQFVPKTGQDHHAGLNPRISPAENRDGRRTDTARTCTNPDVFPSGLE